MCVRQRETQSGKGRKRERGRTNPSEAISPVVSSSADTKKADWARPSSEGAEMDADVDMEVDLDLLLSLDIDSFANILCT